MSDASRIIIVKLQLTLLLLGTMTTTIIITTITLTYIFVKGTVLGDKEQGVGIRVMGKTEVEFDTEDQVLYTVFFIGIWAVGWQQCGWPE